MGELILAAKPVASKSPEFPDEPTQMEDVRAFAPQLATVGLFAVCACTPTASSAHSSAPRPGGGAHREIRENAESCPMVGLNKSRL